MDSNYFETANESSLDILSFRRLYLEAHDEKIESAIDYLASIYWRVS